MLYKFKSKAAGDLIMLGPNGDELMRLIGREPAAQGIIEVEAMPDALSRLETAVAAEDTLRKALADATGREDRDEKGELRVGLRQRVWPMVEMLRRAHAAGAPVVWGV
jgi:hypothetical protein